MFKLNRSIKIYDILDIASNKLNKEQRKLVIKAYETSKHHHKGQKRNSGEAFINHPLIVAYYVAETGLGVNSICAALLHDVVEDTSLTSSEIKKEFGSIIAELVEGVTSLRHTKYSSIYSADVENIRKFIIAAAKDIRVLIIKLADRLHNAQTINGLKPERQISYAQEIDKVFVPLADYVGIHSFKRELEDIAFKVLHPQEYKEIKNYMHVHHKDKELYVSDTLDKINNLLKQKKLSNFSVVGRSKSISSIQKKIQRYMNEGKIKNEREFWKIYDYYAFRIITTNTEDCYKALSIIQEQWSPIEEEFDDYISKPKPNGYRSIHTTVQGQDGKKMEIQIRTEEMDEESEFGPATHIAYKLSGKKYAESNNMFSWISKLFNWASGDELNPKDFAIDVFKNNIYILTPQDEVKELPKDATPVDFAYAVHSDVGNKCRGAKVNGQIVPLNHVLHTGDIVEILTDKNAKYPVEHWLKFVKSQSTRAKIKRTLREKEHEIAIDDGKKKLEQHFKKNRKKIDEISDENVNKLMRKYSVNKLDELYAKIGFNIISPDAIYDSIFPPKIQSAEKKKSTFTNSKTAIIIEDSKDTLYTFANCCKPKDSAKLIAISTITKGIRIHSADCKNIKKFNQNQILKAKWL